MKSELDKTLEDAASDIMLNSDAIGVVILAVEADGVSTCEYTIGRDDKSHEFMCELANLMRFAVEDDSPSHMLN